MVVIDQVARPEETSVDAGERIVDATLRCIARWGLAKTTLDDVAREAGCGRATIYRTFAGGKTELLIAVLRREVARAEAAITEAVSGASDLESLLVAGVLTASRMLAFDDALRFLLDHEPDAVLPLMSFERLDALLQHAAAFTAPFLAPYVGDQEAQHAAELVVRVVVSYALNPSDHIDPTVERDARRLVSTYLLPALAPHTEPIRTRS